MQDAHGKVASVDGWQSRPCEACWKRLKSLGDWQPDDRLVPAGKGRSN